MSVREPIFQPSQVGSTEFSRVSSDLETQMDRFVNSYPLISTISLIALSLLAVLNVLTFSATGLITTAVLIPSVGILARSICKDLVGFGVSVKISLGETMQNVILKK